MNMESLLREIHLPVTLQTSVLSTEIAYINVAYFTFFMNLKV